MSIHARLTVCTTFVGMLLGLLLTPRVSSAQPLYNRSVPATDVTFEPAAGGGWIVTAAVAISSTSPQNVDLGTTIVISVTTGTGAPIGGGQDTSRIIVGPGNIPHPPGTPAICDLFCMQTCQNPCCGACVPLDTILCMCITADSGRPPYGPGFRIAAPVPTLHDGDVITVSAVAQAGAAPEIDTGDDITVVVVTLPGCPSSAPIRCTDGRCVATATACNVCTSDFNQSGGQPTIQDIFDFLNAWFASSPTADFDGFNAVDIQDIFAFLNAWFAGC